MIEEKFALATYCTAIFPLQINMSMLTHFNTLVSLLAFNSAQVPPASIAVDS